MNLTPEFKILAQHGYKKIVIRQILKESQLFIHLKLS